MNTEKIKNYRAAEARHWDHYNIRPREHFLDLVGATNLIPGPNSTEMTMHIGYERGGWRGLLLAGSMFILPAATITLILAWLLTSALIVGGVLLAGCEKNPDITHGDNPFDPAGDDLDSPANDLQDTVERLPALDMEVADDEPGGAHDDHLGVGAGEGHHGLAPRALETLDLLQNVGTAA